MNAPRRTALVSLLVLFTLLGSLLPLPGTAGSVRADHTPAPARVTIAGSLQSELGCSGDWQPECATTHLSYDANDEVWQGSWHILAGSYEYKAALNDGWAENYGVHATPGGANIPLGPLAAGTDVKFYYDHKSHWITDNTTSVIATLPGSFQSELGCASDWDPSCLRSWLQDPDGDGIYRFETTALPAGSYEAKVAIDEGWDENYGQGGVRDGANIPFLVPVDHARVTFTYDPASHLLTIAAGHSADNNVEWDGLRHNSRDPLYRTPGGAVPAGTLVKIRLRTFHGDVTDVQLRVYDLNANSQSFLPMTRAASGVSCYQPGLEEETCDFWEASVASGSPNTLWYRFVVSDGSDTDYYTDNTAALDGGLGSVSDEIVDNSYALTVYDPEFAAPDWVRTAVVYQIFPDRFRNGDPSNDPQTGAQRYDDPVLALPWGTLPEGYCRNYTDGDTNCPWRFDETPPDWSPNKEGPRGRDYMGGDLQGVIERLNYLRQLGVTAIYFNPIFAAESNHRYDTADYLQIDPYLGTLDDFRRLVEEAERNDIRIILDGVFNHMSSDSALFDRYHHYESLGACESSESSWRPWFHFREPRGDEPAPCAPSTPGGTNTYYDGWFGFDTIPVLNKALDQVQAYFLSAADSVSRFWLQQGAAGWRLDVMGDPSFPDGYWELFREVVKETDRDALIIGELWQKDSTLLSHLRGDRADTAMNYRLRDAVIGLLAPGPFDSKGFADSGRIIEPSEFAARLASIREDYSDATYYSLMNLLDSHDTERFLWTLTPGRETRAEKEENTANLEEGKRRLRIASLVQFTVPGAPTVYYGDEVGVTGDDDPDNRRTYPWPDTGGSPDNDLRAHYRTLARLRGQHGVFTAGDLRVLLADDNADTVAYGRRTGSQAAIVAINRSGQTRTLEIPVADYLPDGTMFRGLYGVGNDVENLNVTVAGGVVGATLNGISALVLVTGAVDLTPPPVPTGLLVTEEADGTVSLAWDAVAGSVGYNLYRSPLSGGGWVRVNATPLTTTSFTDSDLRNGSLYYYVVRALDSVGNESLSSNEVSALPHVQIGWANLQWPPTLEHTISAVTRTDNVYGQVWIDGVTNRPGPAEGLRAQLGFGPDDSDPAGNEQWRWIEATFTADVGNNDEFVASLLPEATGTYDYAYRYSAAGGRDWVYADLDGIGNGYDPAQAGSLTVHPSGDTTPPAVPARLRLVFASPAGIELAWDELTGDPTLYGYEVRRSETQGGPYTTLALVTGETGYADTAVVQGATYYYVVRAVDTSFNRSGDSQELAATAAPRTVTLVLNVTVPESTGGTGRSVFVAGTLNRLDGDLPEWDAGAVVLDQLDSTHWTITLSGQEATLIEYKYTLGSWDYVEKGASCDEIGNRQLTLAYGSTGTQVVEDTVLNWRNVAPCGN